MSRTLSGWCLGLGLGGCLAQAPGDAIKGRPDQVNPDDSGPTTGEDSATDCHDPTQDSGEVDDTADSAHDPDATLVVPAGLRLPVVEIDDAGPSARLTLESPAGSGPLTLRADADLSVTGDTTGIDPGGSRTLTVTYTGDTGERRLYEGALTITEGGVDHDVWVVAVVAHPDLPSRLTWESAAFGSYFVADLPSAPFPYGSSSYDDPSVLVHLPSAPGAAPAPITASNVEVVTHLHGHNATLRDVVADQHILEQAALSGREAVLIVPQGPEQAASGDFGRLATTNGHRDLVTDVLTLLYRDGLVDRPSPGLQVLTAHSGGYVATAAILDRGGLPIHAVHLFDAIYGYSSTFGDFARAGGVLRSLYTSGGGTDSNNRALRDDLLADGLDVGLDFGDLDLRATTTTIAFSDSSHSGCVNDTRNYARFLATSGLRPGVWGAPELLLTHNDGADTTVQWLEDPGGPLEAEVAGVTTTSTRTTVPSDGRVSATCADGSCQDSDVYGGTGDDWLVVDGYDRVLTGSYGRPTHDFAARVGAALMPEGFSVASNEAVGAGLVTLDDYGGVIWLLGDESTADLSFDDDEQAAIEAYLAGGGRLLVSGSELGYATDRTWLSETLGVGYVADDAGTDRAGTFVFGTIYEEDYPDVLSGEDVVLSYSTGGAAAVSATPGRARVVAIGFGIENVEDADLPGLMVVLLDPLR